MIVIARAPHDALVSVLRDAEAGAVGPTAASGWTVAWAPDVRPALALGDVVAIDDDDPAVTLHVAVAGEIRTWAWNLELDDPPPAEARDAARALCQAFDRPEQMATLAALLEGIGYSDDVIASLEAVLDLPDMEEPNPLRAVTVQRGDQPAACVAARVAAREMGPTALTTLGGEWTLVRSTDGPAAQRILASALAEGSSPRRSAVLHLWRGSEGSAGFALLRGFDVEATAQWNADWEHLDHARWQQRDAFAAALARHLGGENVDLTALRALLQARTWSGDPLAELVMLLGVPPAILAVLDEHDNAPALEPVRPASLGRIVWEAARDTESEPWIRPRWLQLTLAGLAIPIAVVALGFAAIGWAAIATDGTFVDQNGMSASDVASTVLLTFAAPLNLWSAVQLIRRGTFY